MTQAIYRLLVNFWYIVQLDQKVGCPSFEKNPVCLYRCPLPAVGWKNGASNPILLLYFDKILSHYLCQQKFVTHNMVGSTIASSSCAGIEEVIEVTLSKNDAIYLMPMLWFWMHPSILVHVIVFETGICAK